MTTPSLVNIRKAQDRYFELLLEHRKTLSDSDFSAKTFTIMLDDLKYFWLERLEILEFELDELAADYSCFLLSGAIYLNISNNEHYYFKSLGDFHLLSDPLLKVEPYFRYPEGSINYEDYKDYFKNVYNDLLKILENFKNYFFILPISEISNRKRC